MRLAISWILLLNMLHLPVPCPDLDGECRGVAILSLFEAHAWHVMMLGVRPNDDIDRGPIRTDENGQPESATDALFGDLAIHNVSVGGILDGWFATFAPSGWLHRTFDDIAAARNPKLAHDFWNPSDSGAAPGLRSHQCVWRI